MYVCVHMRMYVFNVCACVCFLEYLSDSYAHKYVYKYVYILCQSVYMYRHPLCRPDFDKQSGTNQELCVDTDPRFYLRLKRCSDQRAGHKTERKTCSLKAYVKQGTLGAISAGHEMKPLRFPLAQKSCDEMRI